MLSGLDFHQKRRHLPLTLLPLHLHVCRVRSSSSPSLSPTLGSALFLLRWEDAAGSPTFSSPYKPCRLMTRSRAEWWIAPPTPNAPIVFSETTMHSHLSYLPVAVSTKWNPRFDLIGILHRNMYIRAHDDHPHHPLSFIGSFRSHRLSVAISCIIWP